MWNHRGRNVRGICFFFLKSSSEKRSLCSGCNCNSVDESACNFGLKFNGLLER